MSIQSRNVSKNNCHLMILIFINNSRSTNCRSVSWSWASDALMHLVPFFQLSVWDNNLILVGVLLLLVGGWYADNLVWDPASSIMFFHQITKLRSDTEHGYCCIGFQLSGICENNNYILCQLLKKWKHIYFLIFCNRS